MQTAVMILIETWKAELVGLHSFLTHLGSAAISEQHLNHVIGRLKVVAGITPEQGSQIAHPRGGPVKQVQSFSCYFTKGDISIVGDRQVSLATKIDCTSDWPYSLYFCWGVILGEMFETPGGWGKVCHIWIVLYTLPKTRYCKSSEEGASILPGVSF